MKIKINIDFKYKHSLDKICRIGHNNYDKCTSDMIAIENSMLFVFSEPLKHSHLDEMCTPIDQVEMQFNHSEICTKNQNYSGD